MQVLPNIEPGPGGDQGAQRNARAAGRGNSRVLSPVAGEKFSLKTKLLEALYDSPDPDKGDSGKRSAVKSRLYHPADDHVAEWMRAERKRAEERAERKWRRKFEDWQRSEGRAPPPVREVPAPIQTEEPVVETNDDGSAVPSQELLAARQRLQEIEKECEALRQQQWQLHETTRRIQGDLQAEQHRTGDLERQLQESSVEREAWKGRAAKHGARVQQVAWERQQTSSKLGDLSKLLRELNSKAPSEVDLIARVEHVEVGLDPIAELSAGPRVAEASTETEVVEASTAEVAVNTMIKSFIDAASEPMPLQGVDVSTEILPEDFVEPKPDMADVGTDPMPEEAGPEVADAGVDPLPVALTDTAVDPMPQVESREAGTDPVKEEEPPPTPLSDAEVQTDDVVIGKALEEGAVEKEVVSAEPESEENPTSPTAQDAYAPEEPLPPRAPPTPREVRQLAARSALLTASLDGSLAAQLQQQKAQAAPAPDAARLASQQHIQAVLEKCSLDGSLAALLQSQPRAEAPRELPQSEKARPAAEQQASSKELAAGAPALPAARLGSESQGEERSEAEAKAESERPSSRASSGEESYSDEAFGDAQAALDASLGSSASSDVEKEGLQDMLDAALQSGSSSARSAEGKSQAQTALDASLRAFDEDLRHEECLQQAQDTLEGLLRPDSAEERKEAQLSLDACLAASDSGASGFDAERQEAQDSLQLALLSRPSSSIGDLQTAQDALDFGLEPGASDEEVRDAQLALDAAMLASGGELQGEKVEAQCVLDTRLPPDLAQPAKQVLSEKALAALLGANSDGRLAAAATALDPARELGPAEEGKDCPPGSLDGRLEEEVRPGLAEESQ